MQTLSVLTPNYNHARYLKRSINSVLTQSRLPDEYFICDDGSTDESLEIINSCAAANPLLRVISNEKNIGNIASMEILFSQAKCEYIVPLAADDMFLPGFFEKAGELARKYPDAGIIFGQMVVIDPNSSILDVIGVSAWHESGYVSPDRFLNDYLERELPNHSLCGSTIWKRSALEDVGYFKKGLGSWDDTFAARAIALKYGACYIAEPVFCWRYLPNSLSNCTASNTDEIVRIIDRAVELMGNSEFRDRFPPEHVLRWSQRYKDMVADQLMGEKMKSLMRQKAQQEEMLR